MEEWKRRRDEIDEELRRVLVEDGELAPPAYSEREMVDAGMERIETSDEQMGGSGSAGFGLDG